LTETPLNGHSEKVIWVILALLEEKLYAFKDKGRKGNIWWKWDFWPTIRRTWIWRWARVRSKVFYEKKGKAFLLRVVGENVDRNTNAKCSDARRLRTRLGPVCLQVNVNRIVNLLYKISVITRKKMNQKMFQPEITRLMDEVKINCSLY